MDDLVDLFGSKSRAETFRLLFERSGKELYLRELHRQSGLSIRPIQQELENLQKVGLVKIRKDGNRVYYSANAGHPFFPEIQSLVEKTSGVRAVLQRVLKDPDIQFAFVLGSGPLDLFVIGDLGLRKLTKLLGGISDRVGYEINPHVMTMQELSRRIQENDYFVLNIMESEKKFLIGNEEELKKLG